MRQLDSFLTIVIWAVAVLGNAMAANVAVAGQTDALVARIEQLGGHISQSETGDIVGVDLANRPTTLSVASTTTHFSAISPGLAKKVLVPATAISRRPFGLIAGQKFGITQFTGGLGSPQGASNAESAQKGREFSWKWRRRGSNPQPLPCKRERQVGKS